MFLRISCTPGKSGVSCHERLPEPRQGGCPAVAGVAGQRACTLPARSPSSAAWAAADSSGAGSAPEGARSGRWRLQWRPVAAPRAFRQHGIGVGLKLPRFGGVFDGFVDYGSVVATSIIASYAMGER